MNLWIEKYRPKSFNDLILSPEDKSYFQSLMEKKEIPHLLLESMLMRENRISKYSIQ